MNGFTPKVDITTKYYPRYGSPESWVVQAIFENTVLEDVSTLSERESIRLEIAFETKWKSEWPNEETFRVAISNLPAASELCSVCGKDTKKGSSYCLNKVFCQRPACEKDLQRQIAKYEVDKKRQEEERQITEVRRKKTIQQDAQRGFHAHDGWYFLRQPNGAVRITHYDGYIQAQETFEGFQWCSIIASVSPEGETSEQFGKALKLHGMPA
jgi:hypothetical protein